MIFPGFLKTMEKYNTAVEQLRKTNVSKVDLNTWEVFKFFDRAPNPRPPIVFLIHFMQYWAVCCIHGIRVEIPCRNQVLIVRVLDSGAISCPILLKVPFRHFPLIVLFISPFPFVIKLCVSYSFAVLLFVKLSGRSVACFFVLLSPWSWVACLSVMVVYGRKWGGQVTSRTDHIKYTFAETQLLIFVGYICMATCIHYSTTTQMQINMCVVVIF